MFVSRNFKRGNPGANSSFNTISTFTTINLEPTDLLFSILINFNKLVKHKFSNYPLDLKCKKLKYKPEGFPGGAVVENLPANAGDTGSSPGLGGSHMPWSN